MSVASLELSYLFLSAPIELLYADDTPNNKQSENLIHGLFSHCITRQSCLSSLFSSTFEDFLTF